MYRETTELISLDVLNELEVGVHYFQMTLAGQKTPCIVLKGLKNGPVVMVSAVLHHDELLGPGVIYKFIHDKSLVENLNGSLILFPFLSLLQLKLTRGAVIEKGVLSTLEMKNLSLGKSIWNPNRFFPGEKNGDWLEKFSFEIVQKIFPFIDGLIDLHCCRMVDGCFTACDKNHQPSIDLALSMNLDFVDLQVLEEVKNNMMYLHAARHGIASVLVELPGFHEMSYAWSEDEAWRALYRGFINLGLLTGQAMTREKKAIFWRSDPCHTVKVSGPAYFKPAVKVGQLVAKGALLGELLDLDTFRVKESFCAPFAGACASIGPTKGFSVLMEEDVVLDFKASHH